MGRREYRRAPNADNRTSARPPRASEARLLERLTGHGLYVAGVALGLLPWSGGAPDIMDGFLCAGAWACLVTWAVMAVRRGRGMIWRPILAFVVLGQSTMFLDPALGCFAKGVGDAVAVVYALGIPFVLLGPLSSGFITWLRSDAEGRRRMIDGH